MLFCSHCNNPITYMDTPELPEPGVVICGDCSVAADESIRSKKNIWRLDSQHAPTTCSIKSKNKTTVESIQLIRTTDRPVAESLKSNRFSILFGLAVFLGGQLLIFCGFISSNFSAWMIGTLFTAGGIVVSLLSVMDAIRHLEIRLSSKANRQHSAGSEHPDIHSTTRLKRNDVKI